MSRQPRKTSTLMGKVPCPVKPVVGQRSQLGPGDAKHLMALFKVFANDTRLRLLHALTRGGEVNVTDLARELGMKPQAVSNQLQRLADRGIVANRRDGNRLLYRIADSCVPVLLERGWCLIEEIHNRGTNDPASESA